MAFAVRIRPGSMPGLRRVLVGPWLQIPLSSTSAISSQASKSPSESDSKIYEMRTYYVKPKGFGKESENNNWIVVWVMSQRKYSFKLNTVLEFLPTITP